MGLYIWQIIKKGVTGSRTGNVLMFVALTYFIYDSFKKEKTISKINVAVAGELILSSSIFIYFTIKNYYLIGILVSSYLFLYGLFITHKFFKQEGGFLNYSKRQFSTIRKDFKVSKGSYIVILIFGLILFFGISKVSGSLLAGAITSLIAVIAIFWLVFLFIEVFARKNILRKKKISD